MISINNLDYFVGDRPLYRKSSLHISAKDKLGLIGLNGSGKSTLLRLIAGEYEPDGGQISKSKDCSIGFLNQDQLSFQSPDCIRDVAMMAFKDALDLHQKIENLIREMETNYRDELAVEMAKLQERYEILGGYQVQAKAEEILEGIGFSTADLERPLNDFSGGWRMRVILAKLLLQKPSLLMLDEPTNHLDLPSIEWLEGYLKNYDGAVIIVSHDRRFLNATVNKIAEVYQSKINVYEGNYDFYLEEKELRKEIHQNTWQNQQQKIKQTERFINRFRAKASKARQVQSRIKSLEKMEKLDELKDGSETIHFNFHFQSRPGRFLTQLDLKEKSYGDLRVLKDSILSVERGDKIAIIGANGKGKSTLLRIIAGTEPFEGKKEDGYNVVSTFYAQHQIEALNLNQDILTELKQTGSSKTEQELRTVLGCFLFTDDDVFKKIKVLSGGEKSRVALAKTLVSEANFMLLDEPTNHLDMLSESILLQALQQYKGTLLVVSHNRHFISQLVNKIWYIEDQVVKEYPGTFDDYRHWVNQRKNLPVEPSDKKQKSSNIRQGKPKPVKKVKPKQIEKKIEDLETKITSIENDMKLLEEEMSQPEIFGDHNKLLEISSKHQKLGNHLKKLNREWEKLMIQLDQN